MKHIFILVFLIMSNVTFLFADQTQTIPDSISGVPSLSYPEEYAGKPLFSPISGKVITKQENIQVSISIESNISYYLYGKEMDIPYELIIANFLNPTFSTTINANQQLGTIDKKTYIIARVKTLDDFFIRQSDYSPIKIDDYYYFSPEWLIPKNTAFLSFRQVDSFENAINDFYNRWKNEEDSTDKSDATIHYFPNLDRIRVKLSLNAYPKAAEQTAGLHITEMSYYQPGLFVSEIKYPVKCPYTPIIYWQKGFDEYLKQEYKLGDEVYIYCSIYSLDHKRKEITVCARDFSLISDEDIIKKRRENIKE
jgi:hypothetical protein